MAQLWSCMAQLAQCGALLRWICRFSHGLITATILKNCLQIFYNIEVKYFLLLGTFIVFWLFSATPADKLTAMAICPAMMSCSMTGAPHNNLKKQILCRECCGWQRTWLFKMFCVTQCVVDTVERWEITHSVSYKLKIKFMAQLRSTLTHCCC